MLNLITEVDWHASGNEVAFFVAGDAGQFGAEAVADASGRGVILLHRPEAVFIALVALPAAVAAAIDRRRHHCNNTNYTVPTQVTPKIKSA